MRILTVRQPWAHAIIHLGKDVENRSRNLAGSYRGPVAIHVAKVEDDDAYDPSHPMYALLFPPCPRAQSAEHNRFSCEWCTTIDPARYLHHGMIIGVVDLVDVHWSGMECSRGVTCHEYGLCSPWADPYSEHLMLANPRPIEPIKHRGMLGLQHATPSLEAEITYRLAEAALRTAHPEGVAR